MTTLSLNKCVSVMMDYIAYHTDYYDPEIENIFIDTCDPSRLYMKVKHVSPYFVSDGTNVWEEDI